MADDARADEREGGPAGGGGARARRTARWPRGLLALVVVGAALLLLALLPPPGGTAPPLPFADLPRPLIFAHRGGAAEGPESTVPTMLAAIAHDPGVIIELDVRRSRDGAIVVIHDATVDRTTNGKGRVGDLTLGELQALDAGYCATPGQGRGTSREAVCRDPARAAAFPLRGKGYRIPTLTEVLAALPPRTVLGIEVKEPGFEAALATELRRSGRLDRLVVGSSRDDVGQSLRALLPEAAHYFPKGAALRFLVAAKLSGGRLARPDYQVLAIPKQVPLFSLASPGVIAAAHRGGIMPAYFIIDDEADIEALFRAGADAVMTDYPSRALAVRQRLAAQGKARGE